MRIWDGGMVGICSRIRSPSTAGNPRKSVLTMATRVDPDSRTRARTVRSPRCSVTGWLGPTPPETGSHGFGVTIRVAMAALNVALFASEENAKRALAQKIVKVLAQ